jgi:hypothetical protein
MEAGKGVAGHGWPHAGTSRGRRSDMRSVAWEVWLPLERDVAAWPCPATRVELERGGGGIDMNVVDSRNLIKLQKGMGYTR